MRAFRLKSRTQADAVLDARQLAGGDIEIEIREQGDFGRIYLQPEQQARLRDWLEGALKEAQEEEELRQTSGIGKKR